MKNHPFFSFWPKQMMFLNKNKGAISKIAHKMSLERGWRYFNIINSAFLFTLIGKALHPANSVPKNLELGFRQNDKGVFAY